MAYHGYVSHNQRVDMFHHATGFRRDLRRDNFRRLLGKGRDQNGSWVQWVSAVAI